MLEELGIDLDADNRNVVIIVLDTVSALNCSLYGYERETTPFLEEIADGNLVFENAFSASCWSAPSQGSILSGELPGEHGYRSGDVRFDSSTLAEDFRESHETVCISANPLVSPETGVDRGFDRFEYVTVRDKIEEMVGDSSAWKDTIQTTGTGPARYLKFVALSLIRGEFKALKEGLKYVLRGRKFRKDGESIRDRLVERKIKEELQGLDDDFLLYATLMAPHAHDKGVYDKRDLERWIDTDEFDDLDREPAGYMPRDSEVTALFRARYDSAIRKTDRRLERIYSWIKQRYPETLFIITSDHGENLGELELEDHGLWKHQNTLTKRTVKVPLVIAGEGIPDASIETPVSNADIRKVLKGQDFSGDVSFQYFGTPGDVTDLGKYSLRNLMRQAAVVRMGRVREILSGIMTDREVVKKFRANDSRGQVEDGKIKIRNSELDDLEFPL